MCRHSMALKYISTRKLKYKEHFLWYILSSLILSLIYVRSIPSIFQVFGRYGADDEIKLKLKAYHKVTES